LICVSLALLSPCPQHCYTLTCFYGLYRESFYGLCREREGKKATDRLSYVSAYLDLNLILMLSSQDLCFSQSLIQLSLLLSITDDAKAGLSKATVLAVFHKGPLYLLLVQIKEWNSIKHDQSITSYTYLQITWV